MAVKRDKKQIRDILKLIEEYDASIAEIAAQGEAQQKAAADAVQQLTEHEASTILRGMDVENINRDRLGLRVASLRAAGAPQSSTLSPSSTA